MGHQIRFYLSDNDTAKLEELWPSPEPVTILVDRTPGPSPGILESTDLIKDGHRWYFFYLMRRSDLSSLRMKEIPTQGYWVIEDTLSPVIEFSRCVVTDDVIKEGRLYYTDSDYDRSGVLRIKSVEFRTWAKKIFSAVRRSLKYDKELYAYVGKEASEMRKSGVDLRQF